MSLYGVLAGAVERLDPQVLFDPLEKHFDLPPRLVQRSDGRGWQDTIVGEKDESFVELLVVIANSTQWLGITLKGVKRFQQHSLVALNARRFVDLVGVTSPELEVAFGTGDEVRLRLVHFVKRAKSR